MNTARYGRLRHVLDQEPARHGRQGRDLTYVRMDINYDQTAAKGDAVSDLHSGPVQPRHGLYPW